MREQRKLAAVLAADVVGYSRLMGRDESGTLARLRKTRSEHLDPVLTKYGGRLVKLTGDGALIEFGSAVDALSATIEFQQAMAEADRDLPADNALVFRTGLHLGDLIVDGDDLYGDGVNIAARLEGEAPAGGILISRNVRDAVAGRVKATFEDLGGLSLKNIERPVRTFRVHWEALDRPTQAAPEVPAAPAAGPQAPLLPLPDKPSIAVLPFQNMSGDPEQQYFADGMTEDILTALSRFQNLFVIARNSSFTYKDRAVDIKQVGRELGVRYVLEGSVRTAGGRIRVNAQLIEASMGVHVWADRYDRVVADLFDIQDELTAQIVSAIDFEVRTVEARRPDRPTGGVEVWLGYHRALSLLFHFRAESNRMARTLFEDLARSHPDFAPAAAGYGMACTSEVIYGWTADETASIETALAATQQAVRLDDKDAFCHLALARAQLIAGHRDLALGSIEHAVARNPNSALAQLIFGMVLIALDRYAEALPRVELALRLSPREPGVWSFHMWKATCLSQIGEHDRALEAARQAVRERPAFYTYVTLAYVATTAGRDDDARAAVAAALATQPELTLRMVRKTTRFLSRRGVDDTIARLRELGMPE